MKHVLSQGPPAAFLGLIAAAVFVTDITQCAGADHQAAVSPTEES